MLEVYLSTKRPITSDNIEKDPIVPGIPVA